MPIISRGLSPILSERFLSFTRAYRSCRPLPIFGVIRSCDFHPLHLRTLPPLPFLPHPQSPNLAAPPAQAAAAAANLAPIAPAASRTCVNVEPRGIARRPLEKLACRGAWEGAILSTEVVCLCWVRTIPPLLHFIWKRLKRAAAEAGNSLSPEKNEVRVRLHHNPMVYCALLLQARREDLDEIPRFGESEFLLPLDVGSLLWGILSRASWGAIQLIVPLHPAAPRKVGRSARLCLQC